MEAHIRVVATVVEGGALSFNVSRNNFTLQVWRGLLMFDWHTE